MERYTGGAFSFEVIDANATGGDGPEDVAILLHGFPQDRRCWDGVTSALAADGYRVLAPDLRGYSPGARPAARSAYRNSQLAADVLALADAAGAARFHLAGHDWGAALAWYLAGRYPGRVTSLAALSVPHPQAFARALISGDQAARSWYMAAYQLPWLPERALARRGGRAFRDILVRTGLDPASADRYAARARDPAALRGPLNWYRAMPFSMRERPGRSGCRRCSPGVTATGSSRGPRPSYAGATSPGPIASPNSTAPRTGCPSRPPTRWQRCSRSTSPRRPDSWAGRRTPTGNPETRAAITCRYYRSPHPSCRPRHRQPGRSSHLPLSR